MKTSSGKRAFTLIEILVVIAIIGLLAGILIPVVSGAREKVTRTTTRAKFNTWITAIEQYKTAYGYYPTWQSSNSSTEDVHYNLGDGANSLNFVKALSARDPATGEKLSSADRRKLNKKNTPFCEFSAADFSQEGGGIESGELVDGFSNPNIHLIMDTNNDGRVAIPQRYLPPDATEDESNSKGMLLKVAIFTSKKDGDSGSNFKDVYSWR